MVNALAYLLDNFGEVTELHNNITKSFVIPIYRRGLDLDQILLHFPTKLASFTIKYLGLPLFVTHLWKVDFQPLAEKVAKNLQSIDGYRKRFLWARDESLTGGKCKVNWVMVE